MGRVGMGRNKNHRDIARGRWPLSWGTPQNRPCPASRYRAAPDRADCSGTGSKPGATAEDLVIAAEHLVHDLDVDGLIVHDQ